MPDNGGTITLKVRDIYLFFAFFFAMLVLTLEVAIYRFAAEYHRFFWRMFVYRCVACGRYGHLGLDPFCPVVNATCFACAIVHPSEDCPSKKTKAECKAQKVIKQDSEATQNAEETMFGDPALMYMSQVPADKSPDMDLHWPEETTDEPFLEEDYTEEFESKYTLDTVPVKQHKYK